MGLKPEDFYYTSFLMLFMISLVYLRIEYVIILGLFVFEKTYDIHLQYHFVINILT